ncbi:hypothetical protein D9C73_007437 [Collichthys lucidus]|uniref:Uncharacterized protein n=1 Tax=Collichthys lucidus TaxID=240159 RepID=A0A4U5UFT9_COLLU|nr:hypothetical protein D9C73_007437 [Collichthys lucidus]
MGNLLTKKQQATVTSAKAAAPQQKTAEEPAVTQPAKDSGITQTQEAEPENPDVVVGESVKVVACLPSEECTSECKAPEAPAAAAPQNNAEPESVAKESPAPVQPEPAPVPVAKPEPVAEAQLAPEPAPEPVPEPEPTSKPEEEVKAVPEPVSESVPDPAEDMEQQTEMLTQESLPEPEISSPPLIDLSVSDATPQLIDTPPISAAVSADEHSDIPVTQECQDSAEVSAISTLEAERSEETPEESLEKQMEVEAAGNLEQLVSDVNVESVSGLLQNLELKGNDPTDVKIPDETPITDTSMSTELM